MEKKKTNKLTVITSTYNLAATDLSTPTFIELLYIQHLILSIWHIIFCYKNTGGFHVQLKCEM